MTDRLLLSVHDVTPFHFERLVRIEHFLAAKAVTHATYLLVPRFHGRWAIEHDRGFAAWCRASRAFDVRWFLHGFYHDEATEAAGPPRRDGVGEWMRARCLTAGEAEFLALRGDELRHRLARGIESFRACVGTEPAGFVAPAWLFNAQLLPALARAGIAVTEDHQWVYEVTAGQRLRIPVITWATRTGLRRVGSRLLAPLLLRHWADLPVIRVAIHPADVDHPATVRSIEGVLASALTSRQLASYDEVRNFL